MSYNIFFCSSSSQGSILWNNRWFCIIPSCTSPSPASVWQTRNDVYWFTKLMILKLLTVLVWRSKLLSRYLRLVLQQARAPNLKQAWHVPLCIVRFFSDFFSFKMVTLFSREWFYSKRAYFSPREGELSEYVALLLFFFLSHSSGFQQGGLNL